MPLFRQGPERLRQQGEVFRVDGELIGFSAEQGPFDADEIPDIELLEEAELPLAERVLLKIELDPARPVLDVAETGLAEAPQGHDPAGNGHGDPALLKLFPADGTVLLQKPLRRGGDLVPAGIGLGAHFSELVELLEPLPDQLVVIFHEASFQES